GRPNVGKSSLVNALIDKEKLIVSDIPGTTRDATSIEITYNDDKFLLIDTAGIRRRGKIRKKLEKFSVVRSLQATEQADVSVLLLNAEEGITKQDLHVADYILKNHGGLILALNKSDLLDKGEEVRDRILATVKRKFVFVPWAAAVFISAKNKKNVENILQIAAEIKAERNKRIETGKLNRFIIKTTLKHPPTTPSRILPKILYLTQVDVNPPHFIFFVNNEESFHFSYLRYLENQIRKEFGFWGTAIRMEMRGREDRKPRRKKKS
ncbi:MAG TPA: ribosome biogenesis GTPase Der, partial [Candidatus Peregrinibacteria bacterium]|nr:ribosome biogenesis GTPase Der [Candidatus Peregrinibacteria bacterium]